MGGSTLVGLRMTLVKLFVNRGHNTYVLGIASGAPSFRGTTLAGSLLRLCCGIYTAAKLNLTIGGLAFSVVLPQSQLR